MDPSISPSAGTPEDTEASSEVSAAPESHAHGLHPGARLELRLERAAALGRVVAHHDGLTVLVARGLPGERVLAEVERVQSNFALARAVEVPEPAPGRVPPPCPHYDACGGCDWQHTDPATQRELKRTALADQLERIGRLAPPPPFEIEPAPEPLGYRDRLDFVPAPEGEAWRPGFFAPDGRTLTPVTHCRLAPEPLSRLAAELLARLQAHGTLPAPGAPGLTRLPLTRLIVQATAPRSGAVGSAQEQNGEADSIALDSGETDSATPDNGGADSIAPTETPEAGTQAAEGAHDYGLSLVLQLKAARGEKSRALRRRYVDALRAVLPGLRAEFPELLHLALRVTGGGPKEHASYERVLGSEWLPKQIGATRYLAPPGGFFQVHPALTPTLVDEVTAAVRAWESEHAPPRDVPVFDVFGGSGLFALPLAAGAAGTPGRPVICADSESAALRAGESAARNARLRKLRFERVNLERPGALEALVTAHGAPGAVVCDPPRRGLPAPLIAALKQAAPALLVYVSCDGGTFARDAARLAPEYTLTRLRAFDLFPQTHHLETVAVFHRNG